MATKNTLNRTPKVKGSSEFAKNYLKNLRKTSHKVSIDSIREDISEIESEIADLDSYKKELNMQLSAIIDVLKDFEKTVNGLGIMIDSIEQKIDRLEDLEQ